MLQRYIGFGVLGTAAVVAISLPADLTQPGIVRAAPSPPDDYTLHGIVRDFNSSHADFGLITTAGHVAGNIQSAISADNKPVYTGGGQRVTGQWINQGGQAIAPHLGGVQVLPEIDILLVVRDDGSLGHWDDVRKSLMEGWGYTVNVIDDDANQATFDAAFAANDVVYVSEKACANSITGKLDSAPVGVVNEDSQLSVSEFDMSSNKQGVSGSTLVVTDNTHYITDGFTVGNVTIADANVQLHRATGTIAGGGQELGELPGNGNPSLMVIDTGGALQGGGSALARGVRLPWGPSPVTASGDDDDDGGTSGCGGGAGDDDDNDGVGPPAGFDFGSLNANAHTLMRRSIEWAAGKENCGLITDSTGTYDVASNGAITNTTTFDQWYRDIPGVNMSWVQAITLNRTGTEFKFEDLSFYPIDDELLGNDGSLHNYNFTFVIDARFDYEQCGGQYIAVEGHDDFWMFVDDDLVLDVGGIRPDTKQFIDLDRLGLEDGESYRLLLFYAQRQNATSRFMLKTNIVLSTQGSVPMGFAQFD